MPSITCPHCNAELRIKSAALGTKIRCPECDKRFVASEDDEDEEDVEVASPRGRRSASSSGSGMKMPSCLTGCFMLVGLVVCMGVAGNLLSSRQASQDLEQADRLYAEGKHDDAVAMYKDGYPAAVGGHKVPILTRIVEYEAGKGNLDEARKWVRRGLDDQVPMNFSQPQAKSLLAEAQKERSDQVAAAQRQKTAEENNRKTRKAGADQIKANRNLPRDEFRSLILDKTPQELIGLIGNPNKTQEVDGRTVFFYYNVAVDPANGKKTAVVEITWDNFGQVKEVNFY